MAKQSFIIDNDELNESLLIHDIARLTKKYFDRRARMLDLTRAQWLALATLRRCPGIHQVDLADKLEVEPMTVARLIDRLEEAGFVERKTDKSDRRSKKLYLTKRAQGLMSKLRALALETRSEALMGISEKEHETLVGILHKIKYNLHSNGGLPCGS